jgi:hypothetical protein
MILFLSNTIIKNNLIESVQTSNSVSCDTEIPWSNGSLVIEYLKLNTYQGLTGNIEFHRENGLRKNFTLSVVEKFENSIDTVK